MRGCAILGQIDERERHLSGGTVSGDDSLVDCSPVRQRREASHAMPGHSS